MSDIQPHGRGTVRLLHPAWCAQPGCTGLEHRSRLITLREDDGGRVEAFLEQSISEHDTLLVIRWVRSDTCCECRHGSEEQPAVYVYARLAAPLIAGMGELLAEYRADLLGEHGLGLLSGSMGVEP